MAKRPLKRKTAALAGLILFCLFAGVGKSAPASGLGHWTVPVSIGVTGESVVPDCGEKSRPTEFYQNLSLYSIIAGFGFLVVGFLLDNKKLKIPLFILAVIPLGAWVYVHFFVDFEAVKRTLFTYNAAAERTLANVAEAQDRYKSEHDKFLKDLRKLYSHMAGAHGLDACVKILKIEATWNHWSAVAQHVSSPDQIVWDSRTGSSLKKG